MSVLISKILETDIPPNFKKWVALFLIAHRGHSLGEASLRFLWWDKIQDPALPIRLSSGAVLSPTLFNLFLSELPIPATPGVRIDSYADDLTIVSQHPLYDVAAAQLQSYIHLLEGWLTANRMSVSAPKSSLTLATIHSEEYRASPRVNPLWLPIPTNCTTKILGVTFDRGMTFRHHVAEINAKGRSRLNVMRAMSSTTFSHSKEQQTALYKQFVRPVLEYANTAWTPDLSRTHMTSPQRTQNSALRIATVCVRSTPIPLLHAESHVLPLREHTDMRGLQFFCAYLAEEHTCNYLHHPVQTRRSLRNTPAAHFLTLQASLPPTP